jgi:hypothetical protein
MLKLEVVVPDTSFGTWLKISFLALSSSSYFFRGPGSRCQSYVLVVSGPGSRSRSWVLVVGDGWFQDLVQDLDRTFK